MCTCETQDMRKPNHIRWNHDKGKERQLRVVFYAICETNGKYTAYIITFVLQELDKKPLLLVGSRCQVLADLNRCFYSIKFKISISVLTQILMFLLSKLNTCHLGTFQQLSKTQKDQETSLETKLFATDFTMMYWQSCVTDSATVSNWVSFCKQGGMRWLWIIHYNMLDLLEQHSRCVWAWSGCGMMKDNKIAIALPFCFA